jgi:nitrate/TMAO reductase-like tetraheme cytochrome c subunit
MSQNEKPPEPRASLLGLWNWISLAGLIVIAGSIFAFVFLFLADLFRSNPNPYIGILTYLVAPMFSTLGVAMALVGYAFRRRELKYHGHEYPLLIDLARLRDRRILAWFAGGGAFFLLVSAIGSYHSYHFTESTTFCGQACHTVMEPEFITYQNSYHARVGCVECHIGPGAKWYVKAKLSGLYQVYATVASKFPRPIPTPIKNLRPARDTCEQCHWPEKFSGNFVRTYNHFLSDDDNTEYSVRLLLKVGGGTPEFGEVPGIHWHIANVVEYVAADETRMEIPWVRYVAPDGTSIEYRAEGFEDEIDPTQIRRMDCMDCHNRPAHIYHKPNDAVDRAMAAGLIDQTLPAVRWTATELLVGEYSSVEEAMDAIDTGLREAYPDAQVDSTITSVQAIYRRNFFPLMQASWLNYPEHIGHKDWPGCARCHDDNHKSSDGNHVIGFQDCNACHLILAQGTSEDLEQPSMSGQAFKHPGEDLDPDFKCNDCHTGGP